MKFRSKRGTAMMMVIGLLCIILVLGASFLVIAHLDAQQSAAIAQKNQADPIVGGIVQQLQASLVNGLYCSATGPYSKPATTTPVPLLRYVDAATVDNESVTCSGTAANKFDIFLASSCTITGGVWPHLTNLYNAAPAAGDIVSVASSGASATNPLVDTDNDGVPDARLFDTGVYGSDGRKYYAAVRVIDTSGLININTAGSAMPNPLADPPDLTNWPPYISPFAIDLNSFLSLINTALYPTLHSDRCTPFGGALSSTLAKDYNAGAGLRVFTPSTSAGYSYRPFGVNDEVVLRWNSALTRSSSNSCSRLWTDLSSLPANSAILPLLTTHSCSRALPRAPVAGAYGRINLSDTSVSNPLDTAATRTTLVAKLATIGAPDADAAHFVANLWAALDSNITLSSTRAYQVTRSTTANGTVFGVIPHPVISEAFGTFQLSATTAPTKWLWGVELYNPYSFSLPISNYSFYGTTASPATRIPFTSITGVPASLTAGSRIVLYDYASGSTPTTDFTVTPGANWYRITTSGTCSLATSGTYMLSRAAEGQTCIFVDGIVVNPSLGTGTTAGIPWSLNVAQTGTGSGQRWLSSQRDDSTTRNRYLGCLYKTSTGTGAPGANNNLGSANTVSGTDISVLYPGYTLDTIRCSTTKILTFGQLGKIFVGGSEQSSTGSPTSCLPLQISSSQATRKKVDFHGALGATTAAYPDTPWATTLGELFEVIPGDPARTDDPYDTRIYGRINVNTAYVDPVYPALNVLRYLPWPTTAMTVTPSSGSPFTITMQNTPGTPATDTIGAAIEYILAYRDMRAVSWGSTITIGGSPRTLSRTYASRATGSSITNLRANTAVRAYLTPSEIAIPLADFMNDLMGWTAGSTVEKAPEYLDVRDSLYRAIGNCITVNSDTYVAYIFVMAVPAGYANTLTTAITDSTVVNWRYLTMLDRSNCRLPTDRPAVLLLAPVYK